MKDVGGAFISGGKGNIPIRLLRETYPKIRKSLPISGIRNVDQSSGGRFLKPTKCTTSHIFNPFTEVGFLLFVVLPTQNTAPYEQRVRQRLITWKNTAQATFYSPCRVGEER